ncbi:MAG: metalloregulator ArsR/SmtB family transcription factor [Pseudomonadota bacterium]
MLPTAKFFSCISDPVRLASMLLLQTEGELCVCELVCALDESQSKVSRHLAQLRHCALLHDRRQGQWVYYSLNPDLPDWTLPTLDLAAEAEAGMLEIMRNRLHLMTNRPERIAC